MREKPVQDRSNIDSLGRVMKGRNVSMEVTRAFRYSILLPKLMYGSETRTWNRAHRSTMHTVEMSYMRGACGATRWVGESNENVYKRCGGMGEKKYVNVV